MSLQPKNLTALTPHDQLKFIVAGLDDYAFAREWIAKHSPLPCPVYIHPVGGVSGPVLTQLAEAILADRLDVRLGLQLHKLIWGERPGV